MRRRTSDAATMSFPLKLPQNITGVRCRDCRFSCGGTPPQRVIRNEDALGLGRFAR